jgi:hypothetical protein
MEVKYFGINWRLRIGAIALCHNFDVPDCLACGISSPARVITGIAKSKLANVQRPMRIHKAKKNGGELF